MPDTLTKLAYKTFQQGKNYFGLAHKTLSSRLRNLVGPEIELNTQPLGLELIGQVHQRFEQLLETDWQDAERGIYPVSLLFDNPWEDFFRYYPILWVDLPQTWDRVSKKQYHQFPAQVPTEGYPKYYLQNFHYQTDGYLSEYSANLYDLQVEILFGGSADPMRRRVLAPLKQGLQPFNSIPPHQIRILDIACGTGRTLRMIRGAFSQAALFGTDLSAAYLRKANQLLSEIPGELPQLLQTNAEALPYLDHYFHGVTCVFLFHELPAQARQNVIEQAFRVIQPGGVFVICDSIQALDSPEMMPMLENFPAMFHEPYYRHYIEDDLVERLDKAGFVDISTANHFLSKYWVAHKPL